MKGCLTLLGNVIWLLAGGIICGLTWFLTGLLLCITIIGIPFGKQCFKFASLSFAPFGKTVVSDFGAHPVMNVIWIIFSDGRCFYLRFSAVHCFVSL